MYPQRITAVSTAFGRSRGFSGFSAFGPRSLKEICKLELFEREDPEKCGQIWTEFHATKKDAVGLVVDSPTCLKIFKRAKQCPNFILPVFKGSDNSHLILLSQFQRNAFLFTTLEEFKSNPGNSSLCLSVALFDDMVETKGLGMLRADFLPALTKKEATVLSSMLVESYSSDGWVDVFNLSPKTFDYEAYFAWTTKFKNRFLD